MLPFSDGEKNEANLGSSSTYLQQGGLCTPDLCEGYEYCQFAYNLSARASGYETPKMVMAFCYILALWIETSTKK